MLAHTHPTAQALVLGHFRRRSSMSLVVNAAVSVGFYPIDGRNRVHVKGFLSGREGRAS